MKKLIYLLPLVLLLSCDGMSDFNCQQKVKEKFPSSEVYELRSFHYLVIDTSKNIWYVESMDISSPEITNELLIKKGN